MDRPTTGAHLVQDLLAKLNDRALGHAVLLYAVDYQGLDVSRGLVCDGREGVRQGFAQWLEAFPDLQVTTHDILVAANQVTIHWTLEGTHQGPFMRIPKTGQPVTISGFSLMTLRAGLFTRGLHLWDMAGMLRAMKLLPDLPSSYARTSAAPLETHS